MSTNTTSDVQLRKQILCEPFSCLTLLDWAPALSASEVFEMFIQFFENVGAKPSIFLGSAGIESKTIGSKKSLLKTLTERNEECFDIVLRRERDDFRGAWDVSCMYYDANNRFESTKGLSCLQVAVSERLCNFQSDYFKDVVTFLANRARPCYGYAFTATYATNLETYGPGLAGALPIDNQIEDAYSWSLALGKAMRERVERPHQLGLQRFVYPENYLSAIHLDKKVEGISLRSWINAASRRGNLTTLTRDLFVWVVPTDHINDVRISLGEAGLLVGYKQPQSQTSIRSKLS
jgi:hypothetical protein